MPPTIREVLIKPLRRRRTSSDTCVITRLRGTARCQQRLQQMLLRPPKVSVAIDLFSAGACHSRCMTQKSWILQSTPFQRSAKAFPTSSLLGGTAQIASSGPQPPTSSAHAFRQGVLQHPQTLESFRQPDSMSFLSCESSDNQRYSIMPIGSTPEQQIREYHHRMQPSNAQEWQRLRQQQRGPPATPLLTSSVYPTRLPSFESSFGSGVGSMKSATISSSSKQESEEDANEHVEKCMRQ